MRPPIFYLFTWVAQPARTRKITEATLAKWTFASLSDYLVLHPALGAVFNRLKVMLDSADQKVC